MGERAVGAARRRRENTELRRRSGSSTELIGISTGINAVRSAVEKVAPTGSRVLITGPAGAGKEVVARRIHERSRRAAGPFVVLNCATLTPDRLEAELFGNEPGGREPRTVGTLELAHQGTLLLDEVADLPIQNTGTTLRKTEERRGGKRGSRTGKQ